ncbi:LicD family protein [Candidatus Deianiraea vastatrix]|uniref:LicD family protein n=1 Tax=Candidatus Deianiraea vastatrix TaxID=2163644 RepID=A0A5B8XEU8_9RICK|nr:LicD family protein [Candidatus Deianiraea vastatrix]QED23770.1 LicD family protein [Candidatus Deianiraea vastatrix]
MKKALSKFACSCSLTSINCPIFKFFLIGYIFFSISHTKQIERKLDKLSANNRVILANITDISKLKPATGITREIQIYHLNLLAKLDKILKANNLSYWADWGTLIGAVRHKGFIPWDDDIDLGMMRKDYEILRSKIKELKTDEISFHVTDIIHVRDEKNDIEIDIFPYDFANKEHFEKQMKERVNFVKYWRKIALTKTMSAKWASEIAKKYETQDSDLIIGGIEYPHEETAIKTYAKSTIFPLKYAQFENIQIPVPNNSDVYLKTKFGNYMSLPSDFGCGMHSSGC